MFLRDLWYFGALSGELKPGQHLHRELLGQPILFGRDHQGRAYALRDVCPHRGILLSAGEAREHDGETQVECPYHGWRFRTDGSCAAIPSLTADQAAAMDLSKIRTRAFPVHEDQGLIWVFYAAEENAGAAPADGPPKLEIPAGQTPRMTVTDIADCPVDQAVAGLIDGRDSEQDFDPIEGGFSTLPDTPAANSWLHTLLGKNRTAQIQLRLPGLRYEYIRAGGKLVTVFTAVTPIDEHRSAIAMAVYGDHPLLKLIPHPILRALLGRNRGAMRIPDADVQAKWYFALKRAWETHRETGEPFQNPVKRATLRWRS